MFLCIHFMYTCIHVKHNMIRSAVVKRISIDNNTMLCE